MITTTVLVFIFFSLTGMPIAFALGMAGMAGILVGGFPMVQLSGKVVYSIDNFPLMSIPLFILAGELMEASGISARLVALAQILVGWLRGGLGMTVVVTEIFFSGIRCSLQIFAMKYCVSGAMSSTRARSDGSGIGMTLIR